MWVIKGDQDIHTHTHTYILLLCIIQEAEEPSDLYAQYPRKKAIMTFGSPLDKIRDLKLPKKLEMEKRKVT